MFGSNSPSVLGFVSIRHATSVSAFARRSSMSTPPSRVRRDLHDLQARHRDRGGVRAVRGVGCQDLVAVLAAVLVVGARQQHARELAVRARGRLQRDVREPGDLRRGRPAGSTSAPALPAPARGPGAGAGARARAARRRARAAAGCASSCTSRAGRSPSPGRSCAWTGRRSGARSRARRPRAAAPGWRREALGEQLGRRARATSSSGAH